MKPDTGLVYAGALIATLSAAGLAQAQDVATYRLDVSYDWSAQTHPESFPQGGHLTRFYGVTHNGRYVMFRDGQTPSSGLVLVAENGRDTILQAEFADALRRKRIGDTFIGDSTSEAPASVSVTFKIGPDHPLVSFSTMIAPSPDWFTGVSGVSLRADDAWLDRVTVPLWAWDAGSDSGADYASPNEDTQPRESVRLLVGGGFLTADGLRPMGSAVLTRLE